MSAESADPVGLSPFYLGAEPPDPRRGRAPGPPSMPGRAPVSGAGKGADPRRPLAFLSGGRAPRPPPGASPRTPIDAGSGTCVGGRERRRPLSRLTPITGRHAPPTLAEGEPSEPRQCRLGGGVGAQTTWPIAILRASRSDLAGATPRHLGQLRVPAGQPCMTGSACAALRGLPRGSSACSPVRVGACRPVNGMSPTVVWVPAPPKGEPTKSAPFTPRTTGRPRLTFGGRSSSARP
ncbi:hypothetical protein LX90_004202 [Lentzea flava]|nr:hypothetical protein [Lentzea flava]